MKKLFHFLKTHKAITVIIILVILVGGYFLLKPVFSKSSTPNYITTKVERTDLINSISVTGQTTAQNKVTLTPRVSGEVTYINLANGKAVKKGEILLKIKDDDARNAVRDAQIALDNAKRDLSKMEGLATNEGSIESIKAKRQKDLSIAYQKAVDGLPAIFTSTTPNIITSLHDLLFQNDLSANDDNVDYYGKSLVLYNKSALQYSEATRKAYDLAKSSYDIAAANYKSNNLTYYSNTQDIEQAVNLTYEALKNINDAVRAALNIVHLYKDSMTEMKLQYPSLVDDQDKILTSYFNITSDLFNQIDTIKNNIQTAKENLINADFDLSDQQTAVDKAERNLKTALDKLADYTLTAPFDGILGNVTEGIHVGDNVSPSTNLATLISQQYMIDISLTETDAAQVEIGQKANITFDALDNVILTGRVVDMDVVGTVSQGVVSYGAKVLLDKMDERIKPGMSATVEIIVATKPNVLAISRVALKSQNNQYFVRVLKSDGTVEMRPVEIGLETDSKVEIVSGITEGESIIIGTVSTSTSGTNLLRSNNLYQRNTGGSASGNIPQMRMPGGF
ncbi:MAG TPA: efflux RND transporter periplasmic adaptor subunit [Candidatus Paceibacterota bacterium]|nr:efflux RND transporter periplasmic adaptor subunit [Candidatus Paceibacterota bacterium]